MFLLILGACILMGIAFLVAFMSGCGHNPVAVMGIFMGLVFCVLAGMDGGHSGGLGSASTTMPPPPGPRPGRDE
jgi:hypothetical protein